MDKLSRNKGKRVELELSHFLTERGFPARRGQQFSGGPDSPDAIVFHRRNRKPWIVVMDTKQYLALLSQENNKLSL